MNQVSLVAFYKEKQEYLSSFLNDLNNKLKQCLGSSYTAYSVNQIHATLIGLERLQRPNEIYNFNFHTNYGVERVMHIQETLRHIDNTSLLPIPIKIGGYLTNTDYGFTSFGQHPWNRTFTIHENKIILMGWPVHTAIDSYPLANLRRSFEEFGILHKWHRKPLEIDNDCYFVLGLIEPGANCAIKVTKTLLTMRNHLAEITPVTLTLTKDTLSFVSYTDITLPSTTTRNLTISEAIRDPDQLTSLLTN